ncbi:MAG: nascent polypeptide-associated complex protein [Candidatus Micrarchaeaceae archaeon]|jgi:nascent polypeptide-associated complex subunit alpha
MMPNMDPRTMRNLMAKMGIKSSEIPAERVVIETSEVNIIIDNPQITKIEAQGTISFQISGDIKEVQKNTAPTITDEDVSLVAERTGIEDKEHIKEALEKNNGDIAQTIIDLTEEKN